MCVVTKAGELLLVGVTEDFFAELLEEEFLDLMLHSVLKRRKNALNSYDWVYKLGLGIFCENFGKKYFREEKGLKNSWKKPERNYYKFRN